MPYSAGHRLHRTMYVEVAAGKYGSSTTPAVVNPLHVVSMLRDSENVTILELTDGRRLRVEGCLAEMEALLKESLAASGVSLASLRDRGEP